MSAKLSSTQDEVIQLKLNLAAALDPRDTYETPKARKNNASLPQALLIGTSNIKGIVPDKLTHAAEVHKEIKYTIDDALTFVSNFSMRRFEIPAGT